MVKNKYITKKEMEEAYQKELNFYGKNDKIELSSIYYYKDAIMSELKNIKGLGWVSFVKSATKVSCPVIW